MASKNRILVISLAFGLLLTSISCAKPELAPAPAPVPTFTPTPSQPTAAPNPTLSSLRNLTDAEQRKAIQIALNTPETTAETTKNSPYKVELDWVGIVWRGSHAAEIWGLDYNVFETGIPSNVPSSAVIYPRVILYFGEPEYLLVRVAVDLTTEKAVQVDTHGLKKLPSR